MMTSATRYRQASTTLNLKPTPCFHNHGTTVARSKHQVAIFEIGKVDGS